MNLNDHTRKIFLFCFFLLIGNIAAFAQSKISGKVLDATGEPIIGANVIQQGTTNGTTTDFDGNFTLQLNQPIDKLHVSFVGYTPQVVSIKGKTNITVRLEEDSQILDDVVVVGYGTQKKVSVTGSIVSVDAKKLENLPNDNVSNMLAGRLPGVVTRQTSGMPGEGATILVRGSSTTSSDGNTSGNTPIYIVDGIQRDMINTLSPEEIQSVTVLKDAASAAIYGVQGGAGVILITTKRGQLNQKPTIQFKGAFNFSQNTSFPKFLNAIDYMSWHNKARELDGLDPLYTASIVQQVLNGEGMYGQTDWFDELFSGCGFSQNYSVSVNGGNATTRYYVTGGYTDNKGIVSNIDYNKVNIRSNIDTKITDYLKLAVDIAGYKEVKDRPASDVSEGNSGSSTSVFWQATLAKPIYPVKYGDAYSIPTTMKGNYNPIASVNESGYNKTTTSQFNSSIRLDLDVPGVKGLGVHFLGAYDRWHTANKIWKLPFELAKMDGAGTITMVPNSAQQRSVLQEQFYQYDRLALQPSIDYEREFGKHNLKAQVVYDQLQTSNNNFQAAKVNFELTDLPELSLGGDDQVLDGSVKGSSNKFSRIGVVSRVNYNYGDKYLIEALLRADASVKFHKDNRWGYFPAVSAGWRLSEEAFMQDFAETLSNLKLRASWGLTGNDHISAWQYLRTIGIMNNAYVFNGELTQALQTGSVPYYDITWEKSRTWNAGFEASLWHGLLNVEFDYFYKYTWDILQGISASIPPSIGGNVPSVLNSGKVDNRGFEVVLSHRNTIGKDFVYNVNGNFAYNHNRILQYNDQVNIPDHQKRTGHSIGAITGLVADGLYKDEEDLANSPKYRGDAKVGDIKYKDLNGDGVIDLVNDRTIISEGAYPKYNYALGMDFQYKWFDLSMFFQGAAGFEIALQGMYQSGSEATTNLTKPFAADGNTPYFLVENSWTPENPNGEFPRLTTRTAINQNAVSSTFWLRKGNYLRMKNLQVGCTLPKSLFGKTGIESIRVYGSGSNLFTISKLKKYGLDPEAPSVNNGYYPQQRVYTVGINVTL